MGKRQCDITMSEDLKRVRLLFLPIEVKARLLSTKTSTNRQKKMFSSLFSIHKREKNLKRYNGRRCCKNEIYFACGVAEVACVVTLCRSGNINAPPLLQLIISSHLSNCSGGAEAEVASLGVECFR